MEGKYDHSKQKNIYKLKERKKYDFFYKLNFFTHLILHE